MATQAHACPFCRSLDLETTGWKVECLSCGAAGPLGHSAADAIDLWNERVKPAVGGIIKDDREYLVGSH